MRTTEKGNDKLRQESCLLVFHTGNLSYLVIKYLLIASQKLNFVVSSELFLYGMSFDLFNFLKQNLTEQILTCHSDGQNDPRVLLH